MGWRFRKRLFYILFLLLIITLFFFPKFYRIIFYPSCYNGKQDFNEEGIDCGGPCVPCEVKKLQDLIIEKPIVLIYPDNTMDIVGIVKNPNKKYGLREFEYKFILYGSNKEKYEINGRSFILPMENKYIIEQNKELPNFVISDSELKIYFDERNWEAINFEPIKITLLNYSVENNEFKGEILNENYVDYPQVNLNFIFKDEIGDIVGTFKTVVYELKSGEKREIYINNLPKFIGDVKEILLYPEINLFKL